MAKSRSPRDSNNDWDCCNCSGGYSKGCLGAVYGLGFVGAAIFYIQQATGFWMGVLGLLKALVWPAFVVHKLLGF